MKLQIDELGFVGVNVEDWDINRSYRKPTITTDYNTWTTYITRKNVPAGIPLTNNEYWKPILKGSGSGGGQIQSDWNQEDDSRVDYIKNKPLIPLPVITIPISLQNGYVTSADGEYSNADLEALFGPASAFDPTKYRFEILLSKGIDNLSKVIMPAAYSTKEFPIGISHMLYAKNGDEIIQISWSITDNQYYGDWHYSKAGSISTNSSQNLDATQKETARENMSAVGYDAQNLTTNQQQIVQKNIGLEKDVAGGVVSLDDNLKIAPERIQTASIEDIRQLFRNTTNQ